MKKKVAFEKYIIAFIAFIGCMILCRVIYAGSTRYIFLGWNIFLAWIPFKLSSYFNSNSISKWKQYCFVSLWLLFFPNALYIVTDLIHLEVKTNVPIWYDAMLVFAAATIGLIMAFISLYRVEIFLIAKLQKKYAEALVFCCLFLGAFGVYLGRFLRWNSWDILVEPADLSIEIFNRFFFPHQHLHTWAITIVFTALFSMLYSLSKKLPGYFQPDR